jgi:uncharacterized low-complexity protein
MKFHSKCVLAAAVAGLALAGTTTMSLAKKHTKAKGKPVACPAFTWTATNCANGWCGVAWCGGDGKWYATPGVCWEPFCPPKS